HRRARVARRRSGDADLGAGRTVSLRNSNPGSIVVGMSELDRITFDPNQCGGKPCIRGMRIRVKDVLDMLAAGESADTILTDFPDLEPEDIRACLQYAARQLDHAVVTVVR